MPRINPPTTGTGEEILEQLDADLPQPGPHITSPPDTQFKLASWYVDPLLGIQTQDFTVRELTGRDEEALGRITNTTAMLLPALIERGLESVGGQQATRDVVDNLQAGDWETVLVAIRCVTFGNTVEMRKRCSVCDEGYDFTVDLPAVPLRTHASVNELSFTHTTGTRTYDIDLPLGSTQRKLFGLIDKSTAEQNTAMLEDCVTRANGMPSMGRETVLDMPMLARREILLEINVIRRPGPKLMEVTTRCPSCGEVNATPITLAALFQF